MLTFVMCISKIILLAVTGLSAYDPSCLWDVKPQLNPKMKKKK